MPKILEYSPIFLAVVRKKLMDLRPFQHGGEKKAHGQRQKHTVCNADPTHIPQKDGQQEGRYHSYQKIEGDQSVFLTDRQIQHIVKYDHQADKAAVSSEHIINGHPADQMLPEAKRNRKQTAKAKIGQQPHSMTGLHILIPFLKNDV